MFMKTLNNLNNIFFALEDSAGGGSGDSKDDLDVRKFTNTDDIDAQLNKEFNEEGFNSVSGDDILLEPGTDIPPKEDKETPETPEKPAEASTEEPKEEPTKATEEPPVTPPIEGEKEIQDKDQIVVTEDFLKKQGLSEDDVKYAQKFIGKPMKDFFQSYSNAQKLIGKKKEELLKTIDFPQTKTSVPAQPQTQEEITKVQNDLIYNELVKDFPDIPKDPEERKIWLKDLNYEDREQADKYLDKKRTIEKEVDQVWTFTKQLNEQYPTINKKTTDTTVSYIQDYIKKSTGYDAKDLGYNFTADAEGNNPIIDDLIAEEGNVEQFDKNVVQLYNGIPILNSRGMATKFLEREMPKIIEKVKALARKEGFTTKTAKEVAPSLTTQPKKGVTNKELKTDQVKEITDIGQLDKLLDQEEEKDLIK